jgi:hypothetical protein
VTTTATAVCTIAAANNNNIASSSSSSSSMQQKPRRRGMVGERMVVVAADDDNENYYHGATAVIPRALYATALGSNLFYCRRRDGLSTSPRKNLRTRRDDRGSASFRHPRKMKEAQRNRYGPHVGFVGIVGMSSID